VSETDRVNVLDHYLDLPVETDDIDGPMNIRQYLVTLLATLWVEKDGFSGKRPFGNSGWHWDLYNALATAGIVHSEVDMDGEIININREAAEKIVIAMIRRLGELR